MATEETEVKMTQGKIVWQPKITKLQDEIDKKKSWLDLLTQPVNTDKVTPSLPPNYWSQESGGFREWNISNRTELPTELQWNPKPYSEMGAIEAYTANRRQQATGIEKAVITPIKGINMSAEDIVGITSAVYSGYQAAKVGLDFFLRSSISRNLNSYAQSVGKEVPKETKDAFVNWAMQNLSKKWLSQQAIKTLFKPSKGGVQISPEVVSNVKQEIQSLVTTQAPIFVPRGTQTGAMAMGGQEVPVPPLVITPPTGGTVPPTLPPTPTTISNDPLFDEALDIIKNKVIPAQKIARQTTTQLYKEARTPAFKEVADVLSKPEGEVTVGKAAEKLGIGQLERAKFEEVQNLMTQAHKDAIINNLATNVNLPKAMDRFNAMIAMKRIFSPLKYVMEHPKVALEIPPNTPFRDYEIRLFEKAWGGKTAEEITKAVEGMATKPVDLDPVASEYLRNLPTVPYGQGIMGEKPFEVSKTVFPSKEQIEQGTLELILELAGNPSGTGLSQTPIPPPDKYIKQFMQLPPSQRELVIKTLGNLGMNVLDALSIPKALKFMLDVSYMGRQLVVSGVRHPITWAKTWSPYFKGMSNEKIAIALDNEIRTDPRLMRTITKLGLEDGLYDLKPNAPYGARPETVPSRFAEKWIPGVRASSRGAAVASNYYLTHVGADTLDAMEKAGCKEEEYKAMGSLLKKLVGRGEMPKFLKGTVGDILNKLMSSPKYFVSKFQWPTKIFSSSKAVRQEAASTLLAFGAMGAGILLLANMFGAKVELDPPSPDAYKIRIGNKRIDIWTGYVQIIRFIAQVFTGTRKTPSGAIIPMPREEIIARFFSSKEQPAIGALMTIITGKNYLGEKVDLKTLGGWGKLAYETLMPAAVSEMVDAYNLEGLDSAALSALGLTGMGVSTYGNPLETKWRDAGDFKDYDKIPTDPDEIRAKELDSREDYRKENPEIDAKLFVTGQVSSVVSTYAADEVKKIIQENKIDPTTIPAVENYQKKQKKYQELGIEDINITKTDILIQELLGIQTPSKFQFNTNPYW